MNLVYFFFRYILASEVKDIHMGDTHIVALNDCSVDDNEPLCNQYVALIVAQRQNTFDFTALDLGKTESLSLLINYVFETLMD